jgi:hypothetical protein
MEPRWIFPEILIEQTIYFLYRPIIILCGWYWTEMKSIKLLWTNICFVGWYYKYSTTADQFHLPIYKKGRVGLCETRGKMRYKFYFLMKRTLNLFFWKITWVFHFAPDNFGFHIAPFSLKAADFWPIGRHYKSKRSWFDNFDPYSNRRGIKLSEISKKNVNSKFQNCDYFFTRVGFIEKYYWVH